MKNVQIEKMKDLLANLYIKLYCGDNTALEEEKIKKNCISIEKEIQYMQQQA